MAWRQMMEAIKENREGAAMIKNRKSLRAKMNRMIKIEMMNPAKVSLKRESWIKGTSLF